MHGTTYTTDILKKFPARLTVCMVIFGNPPCSRVSCQFDLLTEYHILYIAFVNVPKYNIIALFCRSLDDPSAEMIEKDERYILEGKNLLCLRRPLCMLSFTLLLTAVSDGRYGDMLMTCVYKSRDTLKAVLTVHMLTRWWL